MSFPIGGACKHKRNSSETHEVFYVPESKIGKYGRLTDGTSVYTAELVAIQMALSWAEEVMPIKVVICSDSMASRISLLTYQTVKYDFYVEILNTLYKDKLE